MVHIKAYRGSEIHRFDIDSGTTKQTFAQLKDLVSKLFGLSEDDTVAINYCDRDGDVVRLSSDSELQTALKHLNEEDTLKLQIVVDPKQQVHRSPLGAAMSWWNWNPFRVHSICEPFHRQCFNELDMFGHSFWDDNDDDPFVYSSLHRRLQEQRRRAEMARRNAIRQATVDAKRAANEVQAKSGEVAEAKPGEVAEKKPKVVYQHFGSWEPKVEKGDNYVITTYGPVGYRVHYSYGHSDNDERKNEEMET